ncbi:MAG: hypothetical protein ACI8Y4_003289 [Candidatus Poriferisodalaceae bacterium]|jgi:uncharacterized protein YndB with AHSA1/START domain
MTPGAERLEVTRTIGAEPERLFAAWTDPAMIVQWWDAGDVKCTAAEMDLSVGGVYRVANETPDGMIM